MAANLSLKTLKQIEAGIGKFLGEQENFRRHEVPSSSKVTLTVVKTAGIFPEGTFAHSPEVDLKPYGKNLLRIQTEIIWAFSSGPVTEDLDCAQKAADFYHFFTQDLYNYHLYSDQKNEVAALQRAVTNDEADWSLITSDTTPRDGNANSPRAAIAAFAFIVTNAVTYDSKMCDKAEKLWVDRCGAFVTHRN